MLRVKTLLLFPLLALALAGCGGATPAGSAVSGGSSIPADTTPPSVPGGLTATAVSSSKVSLSWSASTDNVGVTGYIVRRDGAPVATPTTTSFADTGLSGSTTYTYAVAARDAAGNVSSFSLGQNVTTPVFSADTTPPSVPTNLAATPGSGTVSLTWTASTDNVGVTGYRIFRNGSQIAIAATTSFTDSCLAASTSYTYTVSAFDAAGNASAQTAGVGATTLAAGAPSPLAQAAASLQPGQWQVPFAMGGLDSSLLYAAGPSLNTLLGFASRGHWDCAHKTLQYAGASHVGGLGQTAGAGGLITWDDATNQWTKESYAWSQYDPGHSYYHTTLNKTNGDFYYRQFNSASVYRHPHGSTGTGLAGWKTGIVANVPNNANQVAGGLEWFPELNGGAGGLVFIDTFGASWSNAALTSWTSGPQVAIGQYQNWIAHAGGYVYWGGGQGNTSMYRTDSTGAQVQMPNTPISGGVNEDSAIVLAHPNGHDLLLFGTSAGGPIYRFDGASWTNIGTHQLQSSVDGSDLWVGFTIPDYGVIVFLQHLGIGSTNMSVTGTSGTGSAAVYKP